MENGKYVPIAVSTLADGTLALHSETLGLDLHLFVDKSFRFYDPISKQILRSHAEAEHARYQAELERSYEQQARREAEAIAEQERNKNEKLAAYLRSLGINPDEI
ncbi:MAG: hypothetical protein ACKPGN_00760 [Dolichospermum sp.]